MIQLRQWRLLSKLWLKNVPSTEEALNRPKDDSVTGAILSISWKCSQHETWELGFKNWGLSHRTCLSSYRMIKKKQVAHQNSNNNTRFCCFSSQSCRVLPRNFTNRIRLIKFIGWCVVFKISCSVTKHHAYTLICDDLTTKTERFVKTQGLPFLLTHSTKVEEA